MEESISVGRADYIKRWFEGLELRNKERKINNLPPLREIDIGEACGASREAVASWKKRGMPEIYVPKFCALLGIREKWLLTGELPIHDNFDPWVKEAMQNLSKMSDEQRDSFMGVLRNWPKS